MTPIIAALVLAAAPAAAPAFTVLAEHEGVRLLLVEGAKTARLQSPGMAVMVVVQGAASTSAHKTPKPVPEGDALYVPAPGKWTLKPSPNARAWAASDAVPMRRSIRVWSQAGVRI